MDETIYTILKIATFCFGAIVASFLNVVIWRVPRGESIVLPPSHCPACNAPIRWYQNIPILSYLALRGKCAACKTSISPRYIFIEALGGLLFLAAFLRYDPFHPFFWSPTIILLLKAWAWIALMIVGSMIDYDHKLLPDFVTVGGMVLGLASSLALSVLTGVWQGIWAVRTFLPLFNAVCGLLFGFGLLGLVRYLGSKAFKREAMGMGDVFLMGAVGALYGPVAVLVTLILSSLFGSIIGLLLIVLRKTRLGGFAEIPYGPYICLGCLAWMLCGRELVNWYLGLLGV